MLQKEGNGEEVMREITRKVLGCCHLHNRPNSSWTSRTVGIALSIFSLSFFFPNFEFPSSSSPFLAFNSAPHVMDSLSLMHFFIRMSSSCAFSLVFGFKYLHVLYKSNAGFNFDIQSTSTSRSSYHFGNSIRASKFVSSSPILSIHFEHCLNTY